MNTALLHVKTTSHFPQQSIFQTRLVCGNTIDQRLFVQRLGVSYRSATPRHATPRAGSSRIRRARARARDRDRDHLVCAGAWGWGGRRGQSALTPEDPLSLTA